MSETDPFAHNSELSEIEQDLTEMQMDLDSNTSTILIKTQEMKKKIEQYLYIIDQSSQKLNFFKNTITDSSPEIYKKMKELEKKISILKNQLELNIKMLK